MSTAVYVAKRLIADRGFRPGFVPEAEPLARACDVLLTRADGMAFEMVALLDRERDPSRTLGLGAEQLLEIGKACLPFTGSVSGVKLPVTIAVYSIGAPDESLRALARRPGLAKVGVSVAFLDPAAGTVASTRWLDFLGRRYLRRILHEPRLADAELFRPVTAPGVHVTPVVTYAMLAILALAFVLELALGVLPSRGLSPHLLTLVALGGVNRSLVLATNEWHRVIASALLHGGPLHLAMNGFALYLAGILLESLVGRAWLVASFFLGAVAGSLASMALNPPGVVSVGASGAIMGLLATAFACSFRVPHGPARAQIQYSTMGILVPSLIPLASAVGGRVDYAGHLGGALGGAFLGAFLVRTWSREEALPRFRRAAVGVAAVGLLTVLVSVVVAAARYGEYVRLAAERS